MIRVQAWMTRHSAWTCRYGQGRPRRGQGLSRLGPQAASAPLSLRVSGCQLPDATGKAPVGGRDSPRPTAAPLAKLGQLPVVSAPSQPAAAADHGGPSFRVRA